MEVPFPHSDYEYEFDSELSHCLREKQANKWQTQE